MTIKQLTTPPTVAYVSPSNGVTGIADKNTPISTTFDQDGKSSTIIIDNFIVNHGANNISGSMGYSCKTAMDATAAADLLCRA